MNRKLTITLVFLSVAFISGAVYFLYLFEQKNGEVLGSKNFAPLELYAKSLKELDSSDLPDYNKVAADLKEALKLVPPDTDLEGEIKIQLAQVLFQNQPSQAINIFKEVWLNKYYSTNARGHALWLLANHLLANYNENILKQFFTDQNFANLLKNNNFYIGIANIYALTADVRSDVRANYAAAELYTEELLSDNNLSGDEKLSFADIIHSNLKKGDRLLGDSSSFSDLGPYFGSVEEQREGEAYGWRAKALANSYLLNPDLVTKEDVSANFEKAIMVLKGPKSLITKAAEIETRFAYAHWLYEAYGDSHASQIRTILDPLYESKNKLAFGQLKRFFSIEASFSHSNHYHRRGIVILTKIDPRLKTTALETGWTEDSLNMPLTQLNTYPL